ncbi:MAG: DUF2281 domain-containing protein [Saprospiraceae bacterium]|nr:DUF2281 domain-containing protein [Saprospiraceae bacterium]
MSVESIKLELMVWIGELTDSGLLKKLYSLKKTAEKPLPQSRKPGWGKQAFQYVASDFDETPLPNGSKLKRPLPIVEIQRSGEPVALSFGAGKHLIKYMADDFTAPIEDFKEYM